MSKINKINEDIKKRLSSVRYETRKDLKNVEKELIKSYNRALIEIKKDLSKIYEKYGDSPTKSQLFQSDRLKALNNTIVNEIKKLTPDVNDKIYNSTEFQLNEAYISNIYAVESTLDVNIGFSMISDKKMLAAIANSNDKIKWPKSLEANQKLLIKQVRQEVTNGLLQGKSYQKTAKILADRIGIGANKSLRIVRTEAHRVQQLGNLLSFEEIENASSEINLTSKRVWHSTLDNRTRSSHGEMDGQEADENNLFTFPGGGTTEGPGLSGVAEHDINCRCTAEIIIVGYEPVFRRDNESKKSIKNITYKDWKKLKEAA